MCTRPIDFVVVVVGGVVVVVVVVCTLSIKFERKCQHSMNILH